MAPLLAAALTALLAGRSPLVAQVITANPEPLEGFGVVLSPGALSRGVSPADTVPAFAPYHSTVSMLPRYLLGGENRPAPSENLDFEAFLEGQREREEDAAWQQSKIDRLLGETPLPGDTADALAGALRLPDEITGLFGGSSALDVNGRLRVSFGGGTTKLNPDLRPPGFPRNDLSLELDQLLELDIRGTIGRKVNLAVDFNSEREFQNKNILSAFYQGDEDEILKRIDLGDITVALPPSRFINVGATKGNFGLQGVGQLGPVSFRGIAGRKEGETTQRSLSITPRTQGVIETQTVDLKDTQYQNNRFFLLFHPDSLASPRLAFPAAGTRLANPVALPQRGTLNVWRDNGNQTDDVATNAKGGIALVDLDDPAAFPDESRQGNFNLLADGQDYVVTDDLILTMDRPLNSNEILAVSYVTVGGDTVGSLQDADTLELKLVKTVNSDSLDVTFDYTLRNVYPLRGTEVLLQELTVFRGDRQLPVEFEDVPGRGLTRFTQLLGMADEQTDRPINTRVGKDPFGGPDFLVFPDLHPFLAPVPAPGDTVDLDVANRGLYTIPPEQRLSATQDQIYFIHATYRGQAGQTNEVELGALNILEGSETVTIGGTQLERGGDYQIFYDFGRLVFSDPEALFARFPNAAVEISFEVAPLFNLSPTTIGGFNAVYEAGERVFLNSTLIMQETESLSNRPILGAEPTRSILGEVDGNYEVELPFLTRVLDELPLVRASGPSTFRLRGEAALNAPNPNTDGEVFLNDFEAIELANSITLNNRTYIFGSPPEGLGLDVANARDLEFNTRAVPIDQVTTEQAVGNRAVVEVLAVDVRDPIVPGVIPEQSWRSITHRISVQGTDVSRQESLEFFVRGQTGTLLVELGTVDEDGVRFDRLQRPVGGDTLDTEDANRDNQLDANEDTGLDGVAGDDALSVAGDAGNDDFLQSTNPQGTEDNDVLDSEDLNLNGVLDRREDVLRWEIDLADFAEPRIVPGSGNVETGFRQFRLPLQRPDAVVGAPDLRRVQAIRFTFLDFGPNVSGLFEVQLAQLEVVGSTFLERGVVDALGFPIAGDRSDTLRVAQVNTLENSGYEPPPGVRAERERADEIIRTGVQPLKEQSLVLEYRGLPAGAEGRIYQPLNDRESYLDYSRMEIFTNGQGQSGASGQPLGPGRLPDFFVEFGADTLNVYRYQAPLLDDQWQEHVIEFEVFTALKAQLLEQLGDTGARTGRIATPDSAYQVILRDDRTPQPTFSQVSQLTIGVLNDEGEEIREGSFWVDEWRLTGPVTEGGGAQYVSATTQLGDLAAVDLQFENRSARFRNLSAQINNQDSRDFDVRTSFQLDRLLPAALGLDVPLTVDHFSTRDRPLFLVGADIEVSENDELQRRQRIDNAQTVATLSLRRSQRSRSGLLRATVDRLDARLTFRDQGYRSLDTDRDDGGWDVTLRYDTDFARRPIGLPLEVLERLPMPGFVRDSKAWRSLVNLDLNLLPSRLGLTGTSLNLENELLKRQGFFSPFSDTALDSLLTADTTRTTTGDLAVTFQPTNSVRLNYALSSTRDMNFPEREGIPLDDSFLPGVEALRTQRFDLQWSPPVTDWLVPRYNYNASYGMNHTRETSRILDRQNLFDFTNQVAKGWSVELNLPVLLDRAAGAEPRPGAPGVPAQPEPGAGFSLRRLLQPIRFESSKRETSAFRQIPGDPSWRYTFGLEDGRDSTAFGGQAQNVGEVDRLALSTGLLPLPNLQLQGGFERNDNARSFFGGENLERQIVWPDVSLRWSARSFPGIFAGLLRQLDVSSDYQLETGDTETKGQRLSEYDRSRWAPLVAVDAQWLGGLVTNFRAQRSDNDVTALRGQPGEEQREDNVRTETTDEVEFTLNYLFRPGTRVYLPIPFLMGDRIRGPLRTSLRLARRLRADETKVSGVSEVAEGTFNAKTTTYEVRPALSYDLSRFSSGLAFSYLLRDDEKRDVTTTTYSVEVFVDLTF
ncbi:MAG: hypothetical protein ABR599_00030 [Gemmatimonadota bacterium]